MADKSCPGRLSLHSTAHMEIRILHMLSMSSRLQMKNFVGIIIVLFGLGFLLQQLNVPWANNVISSWWPLVIVAIGINAWRSNPRAFVGPLIIVAVGAVLFIDNFHLLHTSAWNIFWPVVIMFIGLQIALGKFSGPNVKRGSGHANAFIAFSGSEEKMSGIYDGGTANVWFGGTKIDLRDTDIKDGAVLRVWAAFGGIEIHVPTSVRVTTSVLPLFGGTENKTTPDQGATNTFHINGTVLFGGVGIKN